MTTSQRYTIAQAAALAGCSTDTIRRRYKDDELPGAGPEPGDRTGTIYIPAAALVTAGLLQPKDLADGTPEAVLARRRAEAELAARHDETIGLRAENAGLLARIELLEAQLRHANRLSQTLAGALGPGRAT